MGRNTRANIRPILAYNPATGEFREFVSIYEAARDLGVAYPGVLSAVERVGGTVDGWQVFDKPEKIRDRIEQLKKELYLVEDLIAMKEALWGSESDSIIKSKREQEKSVWDGLQQYYSHLGGKGENQPKATDIEPKQEDESALNTLTSWPANESIEDDSKKPECKDDNESIRRSDSSFLQTEIEDCGFSVRALNCLRSAGVKTVSELISCTMSDLVSIPHFGRKCLNEVLLFKERNKKAIRGIVEEIQEEPQLESRIEEKNYYDFFFAMRSISLKATMRFYPKDKRFVLLAGSGICCQSTNSIRPIIISLRNKVLSSPTLVTLVSPDVATLNEDFEMPYASSDAAIQFCSGTARLGREAWILEDGQPFGKFSRKKKKKENGR